MQKQLLMHVHKTIHAEHYTCHQCMHMIDIQWVVNNISCMRHDILF